MAFTPLNHGLGATLACTGSTARVALPASAAQADTMLLTNVGVTFIYVALGDVTVTATLGYMPIPPGEQIPIGIPQARGDYPPYVAGITDGSFNATLLITLGNQV